MVEQQGAPGPSEARREVELRQVGVSYRDHLSGAVKEVVSGADLLVAEGESVALLGESGSGKSTLARVVLGIQRPTTGTVLVGGRERGRRRTSGPEAADVQGVFQDAVGSLDPRQRVDRGLRELRRRYPGRSAWIDDGELMDAVELPRELLTRYPGGLSGGQAQRIAIARALVVRPRLIVADEPTSALDLSAQAQIARLLVRVRAEHGVALLFISHDLALVRQMCTRTYVMDAGRIVESGPTETVMTAPEAEMTRTLVALADHARDIAGTPEKVTS